MAANEFFGALDVFNQFIIQEVMDHMDDEAMLLLEEAESTDAVPRYRNYVHRGREVGHSRLVKDYFAEEPVYSAEIFRRSQQTRFVPSPKVYSCNSSIGIWHTC
ncbi:hypothetical protein LINPERHAP1_LOCUS22281 [Linum perenne]